MTLAIGTDIQVQHLTAMNQHKYWSLDDKILANSMYGAAASPILYFSKQKTEYSVMEERLEAMRIHCMMKENMKELLGKYFYVKLKNEYE